MVRVSDRLDHRFAPCRACLCTKAIASSMAGTGSQRISTRSTIRLLSVPAKWPAWIHASGKCRARARAEEGHAACGRDLLALVVRDQPQSLEIPLAELADSGERLGSGSEVEGFRGEAGHGLLVEALAAREAPE